MLRSVAEKKFSRSLGRPTCREGKGMVWIENDDSLLLLLLLLCSRDLWRSLTLEEVVMRVTWWPRDEKSWAISESGIM